MSLIDEIPKDIKVFSTKVPPETPTAIAYEKMRKEVGEKLNVEIYQMLYDFEDNTLLFKCRDKK